MSNNKQKYYVVWRGHEPGIYTSWADCQAQVMGYGGALYKSFRTEQEAREAFATPPTPPVHAARKAKAASASAKDDAPMVPHLPKASKGPAGCPPPPPDWARK